MKARNRIILWLASLLLVALVTWLLSTWHIMAPLFWRLRDTLLSFWWEWPIRTLMVGAACFLTRLVVRRKQSRARVVELQNELREEKRCSARLEAIQEHKVAVYRTTAVKTLTEDLLEKGRAQ